MDDIVTPTTPEVKEEPKVEVDLNEFGSTLKSDILKEIESRNPEIMESLSAKVKRDIVESIVGKQEKKGPWVPQSYEEIIDKSLEAMDKKLEEKQRKEEEKAKAEKETMDKTAAEWGKYWDDQIDTLEKDGLIPPLPDEIKTKLSKNQFLSKEEQNHPALVARSEIYAKSKDLKTEGYRDWYNLELIAHKYMRTRVDGRTAPVLSPKGSPRSNDSWSYKDIKNKSMDQILRESLNKK